MGLVLGTRSTDVLHAIHRRLVAHRIRWMHTSRTCSIRWGHLVLLTIHLYLVGSLRLKHSLLHSIWRSMSLTVSHRAHVGLHLRLWYTSTHTHLRSIEMRTSLRSSSIGMLSVRQTLMVHLLRTPRLCLRALRMRHVRSGTVVSISIGLSLLVRHLAVALHLSLL